jgi:hypothetical protein
MSAVVPAAIPGGHPRQAVAPLAVQEAARMEAVRRYDVLDTPPDGAFDRVAAIAARLFDVPVATVTIVDSDRIWFKATHGLDGVSQIGRDPGLCASTILTDDTLVIPDTLADTVASANPLVAGPMKVRFYAAAPIITADGHRLGTVNMEVEQLFGRPGQAFQTTTAFGLAILAVFGLPSGPPCRAATRRPGICRRPAGGPGGGTCSGSPSSSDSSSCPPPALSGAGPRPAVSPRR